MICIKDRQSKDEINSYKEFIYMFKLIITYNYIIFLYLIFKSKGILSISNSKYKIFIFESLEKTQILVNVILLF